MALFMIEYCICGGPGVLLNQQRFMRPTRYRVECNDCDISTEWVYSGEAAWNLWNYQAQKSKKAAQSLTARALDKTDAQLLAEKAASSPFGAFQCKRCKNIFPKANNAHGSNGICTLCNMAMPADTDLPSIETEILRRSRDCWRGIATDFAEHQLPLKAQIESLTKAAAGMSKRLQDALSKIENYEAREKVFFQEHAKLTERRDNWRERCIKADASAKVLEQQLDAVKIERDAAEKRVAELSDCDLVRDFDDLRRELEKERSRVTDAARLIAKLQAQLKGSEKGTLLKPFSDQDLALATAHAANFCPAHLDMWGLIEEQAKRADFLAYLRSILEILPKLDTTTANHPAGHNETVAREHPDPETGPEADPENAQVSIDSANRNQSPA